MNTPPALELDVRPLIATGQPPLGAILSAVGRLEPGQSFRLLAPFEPAPLYQLLGQRGYQHETRETGDGGWEILFTPPEA